MVVIKAVGISLMMLQSKQIQERVGLIPTSEVRKEMVDNITNAFAAL